jgi:hypothetical protein
MTEITARTRDRIEAQGFVGLDDRTLLHINYWLRFAPAICLVWTAAATLRASAPALWTLVPIAALGAVLPGHPFDLLYQYGFRRWTAGPPLPSYPLPRRFACLLAMFMLAGAAAGFQTGHMTMGYLLGSLVVASAFVNVTTGFCMASFIYGLVFGRPAGCAVHGEKMIAGTAARQ